MDESFRLFTVEQCRVLDRCPECCLHPATQGHADECPGGDQ